MKEEDFNWQDFHDRLDWALADYLIDKPTGSIYDTILDLAQFSNYKRLLQNKPVETLPSESSPQLAGDTDVKGVKDAE